MVIYIVGVDPGPITGIVRLRVTDKTFRQPRIVASEALQATPGALFEVLHAITLAGNVALAVERFVVGSRAARSSTPKAGQTTREVVADIETWADRIGLATYKRSAADVKPWATDARLDRAGLLELTTGMRHARDAARHALFCAVKDYGLPDPLSGRAR